ncbi:adhesin, partial [Salmonella enterica subsp. enterica]|nr:adhesin [Salmonella enterica subsp. enterica serovar Wandsworth]
MWGNLKMLGNSSVTGNSVNSTGVDIIGAISGGVINGY